MIDTNVTELKLRPLGPSRSRNAVKQRRYRARKKAASVTVTPVTPVTPPEPTKSIPKWTFADLAAYGVAVGLTAVAAMFSIKGMVTLFPGAALSVIAMASMMEAGKLITAGWLARHWRTTVYLWRMILVGLVAGLMIINAVGLYAQLVAAHVGERGAAQSTIETRTVELDAKIAFDHDNVADLDRRLGQIDSAIEEATKRGRTKTAMATMEGQHKARQALAEERNREAGHLAELEIERAQVTAQGHRIETEAAPIRYVAELIGVDTDSERAIRWLIALMVLCCDPLAIALTAAASARR